MKPWERQPNETPKQFAAFTFYRDMGISRNYDAVAEEVGVSKSTVEEWASKFKWKDRVAAWEEHLDKIKTETISDEYKKMVESHLRITSSLREKIEKRVRMLEPEELSPNDLARLLDLLVKVERLSIGEPTENKKSEVNAHITLDTSILEKKLEQYNEVIDKLLSKRDNE